MLHSSHLPRLFKENGATVVDFDTNYKGSQVLQNNPYIDNLIHFNDSLVKDKPSSFLDRRWAALSEGYDKFINLYCTLEYKRIAMESQNTYFRDAKWRRDHYSHINYFDAMTDEAGFGGRYHGTIGEIYFSQEEESVVKTYVDERLGNKFKILINLSGSSPQKVFHGAKELAEMVYESYDDAIIITTGDKSCESLDFKIKDSRSVVGKWKIRQVLCLSKYVDCVISYESGLPICSQMLGTPTIQMMTTSSIENHAKYGHNLYPIQSPAWCSPCNKGPYKFLGCPKNVDGNPICVDINLSEIFNRVGLIYANRNA